MSDKYTLTANLIASGSACSLGFRQVAVNLAVDTNSNSLSCLAAVGPQEMREMLVGDTCERAAIDDLMASGHPGEA